jgi:hypothetical protein
MIRISYVVGFFLLSQTFGMQFTWAQGSITVDAATERYTMAGGIGASWHAISLDKIDKDESRYTYGRFDINARGSAWGGNPPVSMTRQWDQIKYHANWLGLNWMRVELAGRMYQPSRGSFDWENEEMQALYLILDWAETNEVDVFLQQMWSNQPWNSYRHVQPLISAPVSMEDFTNGIVHLMKHLTEDKKYSCIKWLCLSNEPPGPGWGCWWSMGDEIPESTPAYEAQMAALNYQPQGTPAPFTPALKSVREALDTAGIAIPLSGPDWTGVQMLNPDWVDFNAYIGAYDLHSYWGLDETNEEIFRSWAEWAEAHNKPLFISEIGNMNHGWQGSDPGPRSMEAALSNAHDILLGLELGVDAFNRWSFTNRGNLDGQWQLIRTWDAVNEKYLVHVSPEPVAYYGYGIISRFLIKNSSVLATEVEAGEELMSQTLKSPDGRISCYLLNLGDEAREVQLTFKSTTGKFYRYQVTEEEISDPNFQLNPTDDYKMKDGKAKSLTLPAKSITVLSHMESYHNELAEK